VEVADPDPVELGCLELVELLFLAFFKIMEIIF
jgi:hypothetical protein